jgi:signal transduction histidine kinase
VQRWLERITARVTVTPGRIFPSEELLNHVPLLIDGIAEYLAEPSASTAEASVMAKAMELGGLRHEQGFHGHEVLKEYELLSAIVFSFLAERIDEIDVPWTGRELARCWQRVSQAIELIRQATMMHFLRLSAQRVHDREAQLRRFNRMVAHELKSRVAALRGAASLLTEEWLDDTQRARFVAMVSDNAVGLQQVLENLEALSRVQADTRQERNVLLPQAAAEAARQLRDMAQARGVAIVIDPDLPAVEVAAAAVELCLVNYVSNAIKYSNPATLDRWVRISGSFDPGTFVSGGELIVRVIDNGIGIPPSARARLFEQFYRAHDETVTGVEGSGLGLSLVRETVESLGGRAWIELPGHEATGVGSTFAFALPSRREDDAAAAGTRRQDDVTA